MALSFFIVLAVAWPACKAHTEPTPPLIHHRG